MRFSIITPTKNRPEWLPRAVASVRAQTFTDYEHLIFDNGPTEYEFTDPRVRYVKGEADGPADAFAQAIALAEGQIITLLSDDDRLTPRALEVYDKHIGDAKWITALTDFQNREGVSQMTLGGPLDLHRLKQDYYLGGAIAWRRELTEEGSMDTAYDGAADYDLYLRFAKDHTPVFVDQVAYLYTHWEGTDSVAQSGRQQDATRRIKEAA